jgi:AcrR family transcriptional regulator
MQRSDIIQAAAQIFRLKGYHATSMQDIADAVHLQKASLYHHVQNKQDILVTILDQALDLMIADMETVLASSAPSDEKLSQAVHGYVRHLVDERDLASVLLYEYRSLDSRRRTRHLARRDRFEGLWRSLLGQGVSQGAFRPLDVPIVASAFLGVMNGMLAWYREDGRLSGSQIADTFSDLFLSGIRPPS